MVILLGKHQKGVDVRESDMDGEASEEEDYEPIQLILAKQRNGPTGKVNLALGVNLLALKVCNLNTGSIKLMNFVKLSFFFLLCYSRLLAVSKILAQRKLLILRFRLLVRRP